MKCSLLSVATVALGCLASLAASASPKRPFVPDYETFEAGNPFVQGRYADPDCAVYNGTYWVYATSSRPYDEQTYLDAFSSTDLLQWKRHPTVLNATNFEWVRRAVWAPAPVFRNGKYYLYFGANDIQTNAELGGIGVGVASKPEGPYKDVLRQPLIGRFVNGAQPIDQDVFIDDDGQAYIYYGGHSHANVAKLNEDMVSLGKFEDGSTFKEITPENYVEGPQMLKRKGKYYLFWSEGGWTGPDYAVSYGMSDQPTGPFRRIAKILQQNPGVARGSGHNGVIHVPGTDIYYMLYHRRPLGSTDGNDRQLAYDRMRFNEDGTIQPVKMLVHQNFAVGNMSGWTPYGSKWEIRTKKKQPKDNPLPVPAKWLHGGQSMGGKLLLNTNFTDFTYEATVTIDQKERSWAGLIFRATNPFLDSNGYNGYFVGISYTGMISLNRIDGQDMVRLANVKSKMKHGQPQHIVIRTKGKFISVLVRGEETTMISRVDDTYKFGQTGVRTFWTGAYFDNMKLDGE